MVSQIMAPKAKTPRESLLNTMSILARKLPPYRVQPALGMQYGQQNKYVSWTFPRSLDQVELLHLTDCQYGHIECQVDRITEYMEWVLAEPHRYVLLGGDMIDAATIYSPGMPWDNICGPQSQVFKFCDLIAPIRHRILGFVGGNHERRGIATFGDIGILIATILQVPYSSGRQLIDIHYGSWHPYKVDLWHGGGAARTKGAKVMMLKRYMDEHPGAHLYLVGHLHDCFILPCVRESRLTDRQNVKIEKYYGGMSSSFLNHWGTYAEVAGLSITDVLMLRTTITPDGRHEVSIR